MKTILAFFFLSGFTLRVHAASLGSWDVSTTGGSTPSGISSVVGQQYSIRVTGTFAIGGPGDGLADAEYANFQNPPSTLLDFTDTGADLGITLNGTKPRFGAYSAAHTYTFSFTGDGAPIYFGYRDSGYVDNVGTLRIELFDTAVPDPIPTTVVIRPAVQVAWTSEVGRSYSVQASTSMTGSTWQTVYGPVSGTGSELSYCHRTDTASRLFFRVVNP